MSQTNHQSPRPIRNGVFISYARKDGEAFAVRLRERLRAAGIELVWHDHEQMYGGHNWWLQIAGALERVEFLVLVITAAAMESNAVQKEWRQALREGVCVFGVKGSPDLNLDALPGWIKSKHIYDLGRITDGEESGPNWSKFLYDLKLPCRQARVPFMVGDLPAEYVARPQELESIKDSLLDQHRLEPVAITAALRGAGGYGKTTLARALCHDDDVQTLFHDGVLWVTLGERPGDLVARMDELIQALTGARSGFVTLDAVTARLSELLADRVLLMVIDDVWNAAHLQPFLQGGSNCARLITTRILDTVPAKAAKVMVDAMKPDEAVNLLRFNLPSTHDAEFLSLATRLGEWPILLKLSNAVLRHRVFDAEQPLADALAFVRDDLAENGLVTFDAENPEARDQAVSATLNLSLNLLNADDRRRFGELAVFPEDLYVPLATLQRLWGLNRLAVEKLCDRLFRLSLLLSFDLKLRRVRLHDVVRKYLIYQQGDGLANLHQRLLNAYRPQLADNVGSSDSGWTMLPADEPYLWDQLAYHLIKSGQVKELVRAVKDLRYLSTKIQARDVSAVERDLEEASITGDPTLPLLRRRLIGAAHLLSRCHTQSEIVATLHSRIAGEPRLRSIAEDGERQLTKPLLIARHPFPDLPPDALIRTLLGPAEFAYRCALSADGSFLATTYDSMFIVWEVETGIKYLSGELPGVDRCAISSDGTTLILSQGLVIKVWDLQNGEERRTLRGHSDRVYGCAISADGAIVVSASADKTIRVWDARNGDECQVLVGHKNRVEGCAISADGNTVASASDDGTVRVWDVRSGESRFTFHGHTGWIRDCAISADGAVVVSASSDKTLKVWNAVTGGEISTLTGHTDKVWGCAISADGTAITSASDDKTVRLWDVTGRVRTVFEGHTDWVRGCAISSAGHVIASASYDKSVKIWSADSVNELWCRNSHTNEIKTCAISDDGGTAVSGSWDQTLKVWDARLGRERVTLTGHRERVFGSAISRDGTVVVSASRDKTVKIWDSASGTARLTLVGHTEDVDLCTFSEDELLVLSGSKDQTVRGWDVRDGKPLFRLGPHSSGLEYCNLFGQFLLSVESYGKIVLWEVSNSRRQWERETTHKRVYGAAASENGSVLVMCSSDGLRVFNAWSAPLEKFLGGHTGEVWGCAITAKGDLVISVSEDHTIKVWNPETGECLTGLCVEAPLYACACSSTGEYIVAVGLRGVYFLRLLR
jgi:WD40 repeat protein